MALAGVYGAVDDDAAVATLHHALDIGVRLLDTADVYGAGSNERLLARVLADRRHEVVLATKFGIPHEPDPDGYRARGDAPYVGIALRESLERLGVERIDLYYYHRVDPRTPIEETVGALAEAVGEGLIGHIGLSEVTAGELRRAHAVHPIAAVQSEWSLWSRDVEAAIVPTAAELGVGFVPYSPLGRGFFTGGADTLGADDLRHRFPRFGADAAVANAALREALADIAAGAGHSPAQVALAWLYAQGRAFGLSVVPIPGTRRAERIDENVAAEGITLGADVLEQLGALSDGVVGERSADPLWISQGREAAERS